MKHAVVSARVLENVHLKSCMFLKQMKILETSSLVFF